MFNCLIHKTGSFVICGRSFHLLRLKNLWPPLQLIFKQLTPKYSVCFCISFFVKICFFLFFLLLNLDSYTVREIPTIMSATSLKLFSSSSLEWSLIHSYFLNWLYREQSHKTCTAVWSHEHKDESDSWNLYICLFSLLTPVLWREIMTWFRFIKKMVIIIGLMFFSSNILRTIFQIRNFIIVLFIFS